MTAASFKQFVVEIADPINDGSYIRPCGLTSKGFKRSANAVESVVPNCDDEGEPAEIQRGIASTDWSVEGSVTIKLEDFDTWEGYYEDGTQFNVRITLNVPKAQGGRVYVGPVVITTFDVTSNIGEKAATGSITLSGAGKYTRTAAAA